MLAFIGLLFTVALVAGEQGELAPRLLDEFSVDMMKEDGVMRGAAPQCTDGLGWVYFSGHCYMFTSWHLDFLQAEEECNQVGAYLADILTVEEANFIKGVLNAVNPKDGTDYFIGGMDIDRNNGIQWLTGQPMSFTDFKDDKEPAGLPFLHMNYDAEFKWDTKDDANDKDNGFICKKAHTA